MLMLSKKKKVLFCEPLLKLHRLSMFGNGKKFFCQTTCTDSNSFIHWIASCTIKTLYAWEDIWVCYFRGKGSSPHFCHAQTCQDSSNIPERNLVEVINFIRTDHKSLITNNWNWIWNFIKKGNLYEGIDHNKAREPGLGRTEGRALAKFLS